MEIWVGNRAACYRIEKRGTPENSWGGCWEECCENSGCWKESWRWCCSSFLSKENLPRSPSPALRPAPRISPALSPAPSPAIFWGSPFLNFRGRGLTKGWFPKGWFRRMFPRNENWNEGTFAKTTLLETALLSPNEPFWC